MKYYGYNGKAGSEAEAKPSKNMEFLIQRLSVESQVEQERKDIEAEDSLSDTAADDEVVGAGEEGVNDLPVLPLATELLVKAQLQIIPSTNMEQVRAAYRPPPLDVNSESGEDTKHTLNKKA